ncbi:YibE/F family protein [Bacillus thuringiensis]|uniref:YibE/F family protein n=1 Tax=Bacillus thuringiensis TaxID=1428 RepID=UPI0005AEFD27|nr:YibE/F family protein [Bacillus thuringiensis]KIP26919.1 yibE/F-like family protein [Bacillus thuringiensis serovar morrisoni]MCT6946960.1 YibE/F family protein [Bacillus thuringiensis]MED2076420.1 YibE/F family protein [Bacillus thuringiensis]MEE2014928.1 YibE/F family protein [Bacillus thuringiensis]NUW50763.1 YibE/F family protein [Bacillus thuringiensis]
MNVLVLLAAILFILMSLIGGKKGARSFVVLFLNFGIILLTILFMSDPSANPIFISMIACTIISIITLFFINGMNLKTIAAFISAIITIMILLFFIVIVTKKTLIQGFGKEAIEELSIFSMHIGVNFTKIGAAVIIMSTLGAIIDVAISIASPMSERFNHNPLISRKNLFTFGISIGKDILGANTNTLFFAFVGGYLALFLWFKELSYSIGEVVNSKLFSAEVITIFCAGIGIALVIPITSWITAYFFVRKKDKNS